MAAPIAFEFATATRVVFGVDTAQALAGLTRGFGRHALVVSGRSRERGALALECLQLGGAVTTSFTVAGEPDVDLVRAGVETARQAGCDFVVGIGGGSVIDAAKAIAGLLTNDGDVLDYLEVVGRGEALRHAPVPFAAVPTTAGTGSEVTRNAVVGVPDRRVKVSLRSALMLPRLAVVDPVLTVTCPAIVTAATGLDALTQLIEPYVSCRANPMTDALCQRGIALAARALPRVMEEPGDLSAREEMSLVSLWGGMALANAGLGAVHGIAGPLGGMFDAPHGALCAALLPHVVGANVRALQERGPDRAALARYAGIARAVTGDPDATARDAATSIGDLVERMAIPPLREYGVTSADVPEIAARAEEASSMKGNPIRLLPEELRAIVLSAL
jgi:alcohol dehydrogenase class IV